MTGFMIHVCVVQPYLINLYPSDRMHIILFKFVSESQGKISNAKA